MRRFEILTLALVVGCPGANSSGARVADPLDPESYRPHIVLLDAMIFEELELAPESQLMLAESVGRLARDLIMEGDHPETAEAFSQELDALMGKVQAGNGKDMENSGIRAEWQRIRGKFFSNADWFRNSPSDPVGDPGPYPRMGDQGQMLKDVPGTDTLSEIFATLLIIANAAERDLGRDVEETPGKAKMLALLTTQLARVDSLLGGRTTFDGDQHFRDSWAKAREASRLIRVFIDSDADTMPGSPGRVALEAAVAHVSDGMDELEKVGS